MQNDELSEFRKIVSHEVDRLEIENRVRAASEEKLRTEKMLELQQKHKDLHHLYTVAEVLGPIAAISLKPTHTLVEPNGFNHLTRRYRKKEVANGWLINSAQRYYDPDSRGPFSFKGTLLATSGQLSAFYGHGLLSSITADGVVEVMHHFKWDGPPSDFKPTRIIGSDTFFTPDEVINELAHFAASKKLTI